MSQALGLYPHTGWAACVVVAGTPRQPRIVAAIAEVGKPFALAAAEAFGRAPQTQQR